MRKLVLAAVGAAALATATASNATVTVDFCTMVCDAPTTVGDTTNIGFFDSGVANPFQELLTFTNTDSGVYTINLVNTFGTVDFTSAVLTGPGGPYALAEIFDNGTLERWRLASVGLLAGQYTLTIDGISDDINTFGGHVNIQAVPEPATWAMMLLGFGVVGFQMRKRRPKLHLQMA